ncbi:serine--tRNA ligase [Aurantiacibacter xanthus]|uniref:Serine--tRNA ligase n=1 Tax=Aurantiacibacter xanthus TaxID=1784712 RepID=A0A3A1NYN6_9SPHN|nr:serine--tRNA ligase [Aurantiacibacter xanthus]RIV80479.1 serine--tRNA ligase [Aurantiacibacter xanthus]
MHDLRFIRENPADFDAALARRGAEPAAQRLLALDSERRDNSTRLQQAQSRRNEASKAIGQAMAQGDKDKAEALKAEVAELKQTMPELEERDRQLGAELEAALASLPNLPADDVPEGADEADNVEVSRWGTPREFAFTPVEHADLGPALGMEFDTASAMSGARFTFLRGPMARLHRALAQFMLDFQSGERGYTECNPPLLVRDDAVFGTGQLPKFKADLFETSLSFDREKIENDVRTKALAQFDAMGFGNASSTLPSSEELTEKLISQMFARFDEDIERRRWLIPTAEVSLTNSVREQIIDDLSAPLRLTALTPCFRSEAGAAGKDTRGFIRQHQFEKVELVSICREEDAAVEHAHMVASAEAVLEALELPYRKMLLCTGDMGFGARKTFDLEVWLPGQDAYREISSVSWCGEFQARRMNARYRPEAGGKKTAFCHTLNGSGLAVGRTLVAVMENYQQEDGSIIVPAALAPYMGGIERLSPA